MGRREVAKLKELAEKHDKAAKKNGWRDNEATERTMQEFLVVYENASPEDRAEFGPIG